MQGCFSQLKTREFLKKVWEYHPDLIHLHNLHGSYINHALLFRYIKENHIPVVWTLHDCWPFTGLCPHYEMAGCDRWKTGCGSCPVVERGKRPFFDATRFMWNQKQKWFTGVEDMTLVTPSRWLAEQVEQSFLRDYPVRVIHNGIDLSVFHPASGDFRKRYGLEDKKIVLAVSFGWGEGKGLDVVVELSRRLPEQYQIVLVGTDQAVDARLPAEILSIHRTQNQAELAELYSAADVFVNPTREEVLGLVNIEALACGTPVVTFRTGGSPECLDESCGLVVERDDVDAMERAVRHICETNCFPPGNCLARAAEFDRNRRFQEYIRLYEGRGGQK